MLCGRCLLTPLQSSYTSPIRSTPLARIEFQRVASAPITTPSIPPPPYQYYSAPTPSSAASTSTSPTNIIPPSLPFQFPTWNTPSSSSQQGVPPTLDPPVPKPIRRLPAGCTQTMPDVPPYPTRPGFSDFYGPDSPIPFKCVGEEGYAPLVGLSMRDALSGTGMKDPLDRVFQHRKSEGKRDFTFVLRWPGYSGVDWSVPISILDAKQEAVTREELARRIAEQYHNFVLLCNLVPNFGSPNSLLWRIHQGGYTFDRMRLMSLNRVDEDVWAADVCVISDETYRGFGRLRDISELVY
ncbi:hypothetical protein BJ165DRAFT_265846 [Panaeolus papilionaceus]|nr:hypothetical protein BJ165DRAFT_265846 [Panaeolus papilionaceus]